MASGSAGEEEAALHKHGREGLLLRSRALLAFFYSLLAYYHLVPVLPEKVHTLGGGSNTDDGGRAPFSGGNGDF